jgi:catechol 2,3-dioxygenase-like lactoylglutathione lyase family enzyme
MKSILITSLLIPQVIFSQIKNDTLIPTIKGIHHIGISVKNLEQSTDFYTEAFGLKVSNKLTINKVLKVEKSSKIKHFDRKIVFLEGANSNFELIKFENSESQNLSQMPVEGPGITHVCFQIPQAKSIYENVKKLGAKMVSRGDKPVDLGGYGIYYAYAREQNNIMFEMEHFDKPTFSTSVNIGHVALVTPDIDRLVAFYQKVLGMKPIRRVDNPKNPKLDDIGDIDNIKLSGAWFKFDNMLLEIWQYHHPVTKSPTKPVDFDEIGYHEIAIEVGNIENEYLRMKGFTNFLSKPIQKKVFFRDPDGNLLSLIQN